MTDFQLHIADLPDFARIEAVFVPCMGYMLDQCVSLLRIHGCHRPHEATTLFNNEATWGRPRAIVRETGGGGSEAERALIEAPRGYPTREEEVYDLAVTVPSCPSEPWREGPATAKATVKWFNHAKGYGFVVPEDGATDVFLHVSILERAGIANLFEGTVIDCSIVDGERGPQVAAIRALFLPAGLPAPVGDAVEGTVKWFNTAKRYGFIVPDDGGKDIFFHASAMQRSGIHELAEGQRVRVTTTVGEKGPQAELIDIL